MDTQMVLLCAGVVPNSKLAKDAGLELGVRGCIAVNDKMQTSDPDIYAVGDAVEVTEFVTGQKRHIALAGPANRQGRIAADQIAGIDSRYKNTQGSSITKVFDLAVACTGITEATAKACNMDVDKIYLSSGAHAGYYPGAKPLTAKILFERTTGKILGGQLSAQRVRISGATFWRSPSAQGWMPAADGAGAVLRAALFLGQGPHQHGRLCH